MSTTWKARPTTYKGIQMRSRLEATFASTLDAEGIPWEYEPRAFANERGQYLPDFLLPPFDNRLRPIYVEVKPTVEHAFVALERMQIIWDSEPDAVLSVWTGNGPAAMARSATDPVWRWF